MKGKTKIVKLALMGWLLGVSLSGTAFAWWNDDWSLRKKITLDTTSTGVSISDPIGTSVLLIRLHDGDFQFDNAKDDGGDIRFVAEDDKTLLPYHIEKFDSLLNEAFVWVRIPDVKPGTETTFWLYYGNSGPKAIKADDPKGTYDANTVLVTILPNMDNRRWTRRNGRTTHKTPAFRMTDPLSAQVFASMDRGPSRSRRPPL